MRVSVSSTNTCPPPKAAAYSASATDATTTGMRWQWAWRGALWVTVGGKVKEGCDGMGGGGMGNGVWGAMEEGEGSKVMVDR